MQPTVRRSRSLNHSSLLADRRVRLAWLAAAIVGTAAGISSLWLHLTTDPLADVHAYYEAGFRLNAGLPLYPADADPDAAGFYRYPPLLAILFRPLALLPFAAAATVWVVILVAAFAATVWVLGVRRRETWLAVGVLASPIAWTLSVGQAQGLVTLLTALATPWSIALAAQAKLFPALVALWWLGGRRWRQLVTFGVWTIGLVLVQLILEPANTMAFAAQTNLTQVGEVINLSPYQISPILWAVLVVIGVGATLRLSRTRWGWMAAVTLSVLATPRLLTYMFSTMLAAISRRPAVEASTTPPGSEKSG